MRNFEGTHRVLSQLVNNTSSIHRLYIVLQGLCIWAYCVSKFLLMLQRAHALRPRGDHVQEFLMFKQVQQGSAGSADWQPFLHMRVSWYKLCNIIKNIYNQKPTDCINGILCITYYVLYIAFSLLYFKTLSMTKNDLSFHENNFYLFLCKWIKTSYCINGHAFYIQKQFWHNFFLSI